MNGPEPTWLSIVDHGELGDEILELLAHRIAAHPAVHRGHAVRRRDRLAVVPFEPVAQGEGPQQLVGRDFVLVDHLRLDDVVLVDSEQGVVDHVAVVARDVRRRPDRVEDGQVAVPDVAQDLRLGRRRAHGRRQRRTGCQSAEFTAFDCLGLH